LDKPHTLIFDQGAGFMKSILYRLFFLLLAGFFFRAGLRLATFFLFAGLRLATFLLAGFRFATFLFFVTFLFAGLRLATFRFLVARFFFAGIFFTSSQIFLEFIKIFTNFL